MDNEAEVYELESIEQLRGIADPLRLRIIDHISEQAMTVTQVGEVLDEPANKVHYHMRELERLGLVHIVETREKSGILEKYYQTVARNLAVPKTLLRHASPDESIEATTELLQAIVLHFTHAFQHVIRTQSWNDETMGMDYTDVWLTPDEYREAVGKMRDVLKSYEGRQAGEGRRLISFLHLSHPSVAGSAQTARGSDSAAFHKEPKDATTSSDDLGTPKRARGVTIVAALAPGRGGTVKTRRVIVTGRVLYSRLELERMLAAGQMLDLTVLGSLIFAPDVTPALADAVIAKVRHRGALQASPEVKAILQQKGARADP